MADVEGTSTPQDITGLSVVAATNSTLSVIWRPPIDETVTFCVDCAPQTSFFGYTWTNVCRGNETCEAVVENLDQGIEYAIRVSLESQDGSRVDDGCCIVIGTTLTLEQDHARLQEHAMKLQADLTRANQSLVAARKEADTQQRQSTVNVPNERDRNQPSAHTQIATLQHKLTRCRKKKNRYKSQLARQESLLKVEKARARGKLDTLEYQLVRVKATLERMRRRQGALTPKMSKRLHALAKVEATRQTSILRSKLLAARAHAARLRKMLDANFNLHIRFVRKMATTTRNHRPADALVSTDESEGDACVEHTTVAPPSMVDRPLPHIADSLSQLCDKQCDHQRHIARFVSAVMSEMWSIVAPLQSSPIEAYQSQYMVMQQQLAKAIDDLDPQAAVIMRRMATYLRQCEVVKNRRLVRASSAAIRLRAQVRRLVSMIHARDRVASSYKGLVFAYDMYVKGMCSAHALANGDYIHESESEVDGNEDEHNDEHAADSYDDDDAADSDDDEDAADGYDDVENNEDDDICEAETTGNDGIWYGSVPVDDDIWNDSAWTNDSCQQDASLGGYSLDWEDSVVHTNEGVDNKSYLHALMGNMHVADV